MDIINNNVVWNFNERIKQKYKDAMNFLTEYKWAYNKNRNIECGMLTDSYVHTQNTDMILEQIERIIENYNDSCDMCLDDINNYNHYKHQGQEFLKNNNLINTFNIDLLMSKTRMVNYTLQTYRDIALDYKYYYELQNNALYTILPCMKPDTYNIDLKYCKEHMIRYANKLNTIFYHFPSVREDVSNKLNTLHHQDIMYKDAKKLAMKQYNAVRELDIKKDNKLQIVDALNLTTENEYDRKMKFINNLTNTKIVLDTNSSINDILNTLTFVLV